MRNLFVTLTFCLLGFVTSGHAFAEDPLTTGIEMLATAKGHAETSQAVEFIFKHLDISKKSYEDMFIEKIHQVARKLGRDPSAFTAGILDTLDRARFSRVNRILHEVYKQYGSDIKVVIRTGSSGIRYLELANVRQGHQGYRLLFSDDDITFVGRKAMQAANYFNRLLEQSGLIRLKINGFDILQLKDIRAIDIRLLDLLESEKFVGEAALSNIKKEMLVKGAVIAKAENGQLVDFAKPLREFVKDEKARILGEILDEKAIQEAVKRYGAISMVGSCERQIVKAHSGWQNLSDAEKVKYVLRERIALGESGALRNLANMDTLQIEKEISYLKSLKQAGKLTKEQEQWLLRLRKQNIELAFKEIPFKGQKIIARARKSGVRLLRTNPEVQKILVELETSFALLDDDVFKSVGLDKTRLLNRVKKSTRFLTEHGHDVYRLLYTAEIEGMDLLEELNRLVDKGYTREEVLEGLLRLAGSKNRQQTKVLLKKTLKRANSETEYAVLKILEKEKGEELVQKLLKDSPATKKMFLAVLAAGGGSYLIYKMYKAYNGDLASLAFDLIEFLPGGISIKKFLSNGISGETALLFVKEVLYFSPLWPLVLAGDMLVLAIDLNSTFRVSSNFEGLVEILVYAGRFDEQGRFLYLKLPDVPVNKKLTVSKSELPDFFFHTKAVYVPVSGFEDRLSYRIEDLSRVSNEILDKYFIASDPVSQQLKDAVKYQLNAIKAHSGWIPQIEFSGLSLRIKDVCEGSSQNWCRLLRYLRSKLEKRRDFIIRNVMVPHIVTMAEEKHLLISMAEREPVDRMDQIQDRIESLRGKALGFRLAETVSRKAREEAERVKEKRGSLQRQKEVKGLYWKKALSAYEDICKQYLKLQQSIHEKLGYPPERLHRYVLKFKWSGNYLKDSKLAAKELRAFKHHAWQARRTVIGIKGEGIAPLQESTDRKALDILATLRFSWIETSSERNMPDRDFTKAGSFRKEHMEAILKVRKLYGKVTEFQKRLAAGAEIWAEGPVRFNRPARLYVRFKDKGLKKEFNKNQLYMEWACDRGSFLQGKKGREVVFRTRSLSPVEVAVTIGSKIDPDKKGYIEKVLPVVVPSSLFRLGLTPDRPGPGDLAKATVKISSLVQNIDGLHFEWNCRGCVVEGEDGPEALIKGFKKGITAKVSVAILAEGKDQERSLIATIARTIHTGSRKTLKDRKMNKKNPPSPSLEKSGQAKGSNPPLDVPLSEATSPSMDTAGVTHAPGSDYWGDFSVTVSGVRKKGSGLPYVNFGIPGLSIPGLQAGEEPELAPFQYLFMPSKCKSSGKNLLECRDSKFSIKIHWDPVNLLVSRVEIPPGLLVKDSILRDIPLRKSKKYPQGCSLFFDKSAPMKASPRLIGGQIVNEEQLAASAMYDYSISLAISFSDQACKEILYGEKKEKQRPEISIEVFPRGPWYAGQKLTLKARITGGKPPYTYIWSENTVARKETATFSALRPGRYTVGLKVKDGTGTGFSKNIQLKINPLQIKIVGLRQGQRIVLGRPVKIMAGLPSGISPDDFIFLWEPGESVDFSPPGKNKVTARFHEPGEQPIWVRVLRRGKAQDIPLARSDNFEVEVVAPDIRIVPEKIPFVGEEGTVRLEVANDPGPDFIRVLWSSSGDVTGGYPDMDGFRYHFVPKSLDPVTIEALTRSYQGEDLKKTRVKITPKRFSVKIKNRGSAGFRSVVWKPGRGIVEEGKQIVPFQNIRLEATVQPRPANTPLRYEWSCNQDTHFQGGDFGKEVSVYRERMGSAKVTLKVFDKNRVMIGTDTISFQISDIPGGSGKRDRKRARELFERGKKEWASGSLQEAITLLGRAAELDGTTSLYRQTLSAKIKEKEKIDRAITEMEELLQKGRLKELKEVERTIQGPAKRYERYKDFSRKLRQAEPKIRRANDLKARGRRLESAGRVFEALKKFEQSLKLWPDPVLKTHVLEIRQNMDKARALRHQGERLLKEKRLKDAIKKFEKSLEYFPDRQLESYIKRLKAAD